MDAAEAFEGREGFRFVDVRQEYEWNAGHVEGSAHITLQELPARFTEIPKDKPVVFVCQIGQRSDLATRFLQDQGYEAYNLEGGLTMWAEQGYPLLAGAGDSGAVIDGWAEDLTW